MCAVKKAMWRSRALVLALWTAAAVHGASSELDMQWAERLACLAQQTYEPGVRGSCGFEITNEIAVAGDRALVGVDVSCNAIVVGFRGTDNLLNWMSNLRIGQVCWPGANDCMAKVEKGFAESFARMRDPVEAALSELVALPMLPPIWVTGHSRGAALATLFAEHLANREGLNVSLLTLGSPRVGNREWVLGFSRKSIESHRITHQDDPIVHLPPWSDSYQHIPHETFFNRPFNKHVECQDSAEREDPFCSWGERGTNLLDHMRYFNRTF